MKGDSVVNNIEDVLLSNESMYKKIKFLETEKTKREAFIKDLQQNLFLNKQSMMALASSLNQQSILKLNQENKALQAQLKRQYDESLSTSAFLLIEQQLRIQEKKMYQERLLELENNMNQLRKYLQDKQDSFSAIVIRLKKYQDLNEISLTTKLDRYKKQFKEEPIPKIISELTQQRDKYKEMWKQFQLKSEEFKFLKECFEDKKSYQQMRQIYRTNYQPQREGEVTSKYISFYQKNRPIKSNHLDTHNVSNANSHTTPNRELIKLLKKQKLNNEILESALTEAIEKNQELIIENNTLVEANMNYQLKVEKLQSKAFLLQQELSLVTRNSYSKRPFKHRCDFDKAQFDQGSQIEETGDEVNMCMDALKVDMDKLAGFLMTCVPRTGSSLTRSYSAPKINDLALSYPEMEQNMMPDGENGKKQEQMEIEQI